MVVLVDDGDGARVQVDPQEVRPHLHAALQLVGVLDPSQLAVDGVDTQRSCCSHRGHRHQHCPPSHVVEASFSAPTVPEH